MIFRNEERRLFNMTTTRKNGKCDKAYHLKKSFATLFGKGNLVSFFFIVLVIKANVVSHKLLTSSLENQHLKNGTTLLSSAGQSGRSTTVLESPKKNLNLITPSNLSTLLGSSNSIKVDGKMPTNTMHFFQSGTPNIAESPKLQSQNLSKTRPSNLLRLQRKNHDSSTNRVLNQNTVIQNTFSFQAHHKLKYYYLHTLS